MPYIHKDERAWIDALIEPLLEHAAYNAPLTDGQLNYVITRILMSNGRPGYAGLNASVGVLECVKQEFYRRVAAPYEDKKLQENGDVY